MNYLILHLVRGEPTYDIAEEAEGTEGDPGPWFITTGGWRAYPYWVCELPILLKGLVVPPPKAPEGWRDFIEIKQAPVKRKLESINLEELGLL